MTSPPPKPTKAQYDQASRWVSQLHDGNCTEAQRSGLQFWLEQHPSHAKAYQEMEAFWRELDGLEALTNQHLEAASLVLTQCKKKRWLPKQALSLAASIVLLATAWVFMPLLMDNGVYRTAKGERKLLALHDGSRIELNTDTEIKVSFSPFNRNLKLERGEAFFNVQHDADKPFVVSAANGSIRDIGTQFNVYKQDNTVAVTVLEGEVSVTQNQGVPPQKLHAGMQLAYGDGVQKPLAVDGVGDAASWRSGTIVFKGQRLDVVLQQLSRYHNVGLSVGSSRLAAMKVSGSFPTSNLDLALNTIAAGLPVKINRQHAGNILLEAAGKTQQ